MQPQSVHFYQVPQEMLIEVVQVDTLSNSVIEDTTLLGGQLLIRRIMCDVERIAGLPSHQWRWKHNQPIHVSL